MGAAQDGYPGAAHPERGGLVKLGRFRAQTPGVLFSWDLGGHLAISLGILLSPKLELLIGRGLTLA